MARLRPNRALLVGFLLATTAASLDLASTGNCVINGRCVSSFNYPNGYSAYDKCTITGVSGCTIQFVGTFLTEWQYDLITINGIEYSGPAQYSASTSVPPKDAGGNYIPIVVQ